MIMQHLVNLKLQKKVILFWNLLKKQYLDFITGGV